MYLPDGSTKLRDDLRFGPAPILSIDFNKMNQMDSTIGFEMRLIVAEAIHGRCARLMSLTVKVSEIFVDRQTHLFQ